MSNMNKRKFSRKKAAAIGYKRKPEKAHWQNVKRDPGSGRFITARSDKNARVLAATVGGAVIGNLIFPGIGGAVVGGIAGAIIGNSSSEGSDNE